MYIPYVLFSPLFLYIRTALFIRTGTAVFRRARRNRWQATDYAEFRLNYAMRMQDPAMEKDYDYDTPDKYTNNDENCYGYDNADCYGSAGGGSGRLQGNENTVPYAVASVNEPSSAPATVGYHYGNQGGMLCASSSSPVMAGRAQHAPTATVEGVLVVAAAPAPAVLASRSYPSNELCHPGMGIGPQGMKQNGGMFKGNNGVGPVVSSMGQQGYAMKSSRYERVVSLGRVLSGLLEGLLVPRARRKGWGAGGGIYKTQPRCTSSSSSFFYLCTQQWTFVCWRLFIFSKHTWYHTLVSYHTCIIFVFENIWFRDFMWRVK